MFEWQAAAFKEQPNDLSKLQIRILFRQVALKRADHKPPAASMHACTTLYARLVPASQLLLLNRKSRSSGLRLAVAHRQRSTDPCSSIYTINFSYFCVQFLFSYYVFLCVYLVNVRKGKERTSVNGSIIDIPARWNAQHIRKLENDGHGYTSHAGHGPDGGQHAASTLAAVTDAHESGHGPP